MLEYLKIGLIGKPHGVRGEFRVQPLCDHPETRFSRLPQVYLDEDGKHRPVAVASVRAHGGGILMQLRGVADRDAAQSLCGKYLYVDRAHAAKLPDNANFVCDLIGCAVLDEQGNALGTLTDVLTTGGVDVYVLTDDEGQLLFPALSRVVLSVDVAAARMVVNAQSLREVSLR